MQELKVPSCLRHTPRDLALDLNLIITRCLPCKDFFGLGPLAGALRVNKQSKSSLSLQKVVCNSEEQSSSSSAIISSSLTSYMNPFTIYDNESTTFAYNLNFSKGD
ncbi:MAG: hypothetical protein EZS28_036885 [Streblomastix strix]|uniref:Uncharacterized protein n=1 Tax=Streblomastix strix TaxID=222440 RepID=A0A5J4UAJ2_9EUKA|nr:MAG: hypothetical protein EZS28_036885 [Streblomastix strix]